MVGALLLLAVPAGAQTIFTRDTPVADIAASPGGAAVLNRDIPGLLSDPAYPDFKSLSLKQMQAMSGGELTLETVDRAEADLKALAAH
jgi:hypothetical protein